MSMSSKEVVQQYYNTALAGEIEAMKTLLDPNIRVIEAQSLPYGGVWDGIDSLMKLLATVFEVWKECAVEVKHMISEGEWVLARTEMSGVGAVSGIPFRMSLAEVFRVQNDRIVEITPFYLDTKELWDVHHGRRDP